MLINYVPGLALRFYPGLSREPYDAVDDYIASNAKIAIFTGTAPSEETLWNLSNFNDYVAANTATLVYQETTQLKFSYDGPKHKRVIQRWPVDSTGMTPLVSPVAQDLNTIPENETAISTPNNLYALVYCPDKDTTLNTAGNDLVLLIPGVGSGTTDFCSLSHTNFQANDQIYFRNLTVALFQGYQITDTLITEAQEDPENPGETINVPVDTKKSVFINKVWANRLSEAYRDCFVSRTSFTFADVSKYKFSRAGLVNSADSNSVIYGNYLHDLVYSYSTGQAGANMVIRKYDKINGTWLKETLITELNKSMYFGYIVNESFINLINDINAKMIISGFNDNALLDNSALANMKDTSRFSYYVNNTPFVFDVFIKTLQNHFGNILIKYCYAQSFASQNIKDSLIQILIEQGFDEAMVASALRSVVPIDFDLSKYSSSFDKDTNVLTIQNNTPAKLRTRFKKTVNNPTNEKLYIFLPRYLSRAGIENPYNISYVHANGFFYGIGSVTYPSTQAVLEGETVDPYLNRIRQQDYTAISIGVTGNGETDLEYDNVDAIDYIDSFTAMVKIPNKF